MGKDGILKSTAVVSACTALSRILGIVRNVLMATMFGTSLVQSAFVVAFRIPNLFRRLFGEGALSAGRTPPNMWVRDDLCGFTSRSRGERYSTSRRYINGMLQHVTTDSTAFPKKSSGSIAVILSKPGIYMFDRIAARELIRNLPSKEP